MGKKIRPNKKLQLSKETILRNNLKNICNLTYPETFDINSTVYIIPYSSY